MYPRRWYGGEYVYNGLPFRAVTKENTWDSDTHKNVVEYRIKSYGSLCGDMLVGIAILIAVWYLIEWSIRRGEARKNA